MSHKIAIVNSSSFGRIFPIILEVVNHNLIESSLDDTVAALKQQAQTSINFQQVLLNDDNEDEFDDGF